MPDPIVENPEVDLLIRRHRARQAILDCHSCSILAKGGRGPVPFRGPTPAPVLIIGEAPGYTEDRQQQPFVGSSGTLLASTLHNAGLDISSCCITNVANCFPGVGIPPTRESVMACSRHLRNVIKLADPTWILALGAWATSMAGAPIKPALVKITKVHGRPFRSASGPMIGKLVFPTYHPAAALRTEPIALTFRQEIDEFVKLTRGLDWTRLSLEKLGAR